MTGNPPPRLFETAAGMLNAIGLQNIGAHAFLDEKLPALREKKNVVVFANVFGYTRADYERPSKFSIRAKGSRRTRSTFLVPIRLMAEFSSAAIRTCSMKSCARRNARPRGRSS